MKRAARILVATVLLLMSITIYQQKKALVILRNDMRRAIEKTLEFTLALKDVVIESEKKLDLYALYSCGIIANGQGYGSCVAIGPNLILTAGHCVRDFSDAWIEIGGIKYEIRSKWRSNKYDVGFVVIDANLPYLELGQTPDLLQEVYLVGSPHEKAFVNTITKGIICKLDLMFIGTVVNWNGNFVCDAMDWCGGSGGPVLDIHGRILGIYVGLFPAVDNFSICVPVSHIREALEEYSSCAIP